MRAESKGLHSGNWKKRWMHRGSVPRTQKTTIQWLEEEMDAQRFCAQNTEDHATVTGRRDGCTEVLCPEHRRLRYSEWKKRWMHRGSVHRTQDHATVTGRRDGCTEVLCTEHRRPRYSDWKKGQALRGSVTRIIGSKGHGAGVNALENKKNLLTLPVIKSNTRNWFAAMSVLKTTYLYGSVSCWHCYEKINCSRTYRVAHEMSYHFIIPLKL